MVNYVTLSVMLNNYYWTRLSKISWFVSGEQINYLLKPKPEANNWSARDWQIMIFCDNRANNCFIIRSPSLFSLLSGRGKRVLPCRSLPFSPKSMVSITYEQNIICSKTLSNKQLERIAHEQTIICRQLFAGHVVRSRPMKRTEKMHKMIMTVICNPQSTLF